MQRRHESRLRIAAALAVVLFAASCGGGSSPAPATPEPDEPGPVDPLPPAVPQARLDRVAGCEELTTALRADATFKVGVQATSLRESGWNPSEFEGGFEPVPAPSGPDLTEDPGVDGGVAPGDFTDTNVQVGGVDEADIVETDGQRIYLLHGGTFVVLDSRPPEETALESSTEIEGYPQAMFVAGGRAVVFSTVYDDLEAFGGSDDCGFIGPPLPVVEPALVGDIAPCWPSYTKVTVLDVAAAPSVVREVYLEGTYTAARRHDAIVRVVVQGGHGLPPEIPDFWGQLYSGEWPASAEEFLERVDAWEQAAQAAIEATALEDWLPSQWERRAGELSEVPPLCSEVHLPPVGESDHGMTRVLALDMTEDEGELHDALVVGGAGAVYASLDRLVLAQQEWDVGDDGDRTAIHLFEVGADTLTSTYLGSGYVPGVPMGQFSFDMRDDVLRVATTETAPTGPGGEFSTASQIVTARLEGGALVTVGTTGGLAPGERLFAVRYIGDRGYIVTFRQIDPLFVIDLSDAASPTVLGEVELPGFSEYMHPLGDDHLLTIGQDTDLEGRVRGLALRIFDVSDDANPVLAHVHLFEGQGWSAANQDHHAFVFDSARGLLTFPYVSYEGDFQSVLELFSVDAAAGFEQVGEVDHTDLTQAQCGSPEEWQCQYAPEIRRGLFIEDFLYSISGVGVRAHASSDLETPVATVVLPASGGGFPGGPVPAAVP